MIRPITFCTILMVGLFASTTRLMATTLPFTETFSSDVAGWTESSGVGPLTFNAAGGPDGSSYASGTFNFLNSTFGDQGPVVIRGQEPQNASSGAFIGNWIADGITQFSASVRHDAGVPLSYFTRFAAPVTSFPGAIGIVAGPPAPSGVWTDITFPIVNAGPPFGPFVSYEGTSFAAVFSNVGRIQVGVEIPAALAGVDQDVTFDIDNISIVPEPSSIMLAVCGLMALVLSAGRRQRPIFRRIVA